MLLEPVPIDQGRGPVEGVYHCTMWRPNTRPGGARVRDKDMYFLSKAQIAITSTTHCVLGRWYASSRACLPQLIRWRDSGYWPQWPYCRHTLSCDTHGWSRAGMIRRRLQQCKQHKHTDYSSSLGEPRQQMTTSDQTLLVTVDHDCVAVCCDWLRLRARTCLETRHQSSGRH